MRKMVQLYIEQEAGGMIFAIHIGEDHKAFVKLNFLNATVVLSTTPGLGVYQ